MVGPTGRPHDRAEWQRVRVHSIRWRGERPDGESNGCIFTGRVLDENDHDTGEVRICVLPGSLLGEGARVFAGDVWDVSGRPEAYRGQPQIRCTDAALARPSGSSFIRIVGGGARFTNIGPAIAKKLWDRFGEELFGLLDNEQADPLEEILRPDLARSFIQQWKAFGLADVLRWLTRHRFPPRLGAKIAGYYGADAVKRLNRDPYRLLAFDPRWNRVDGLARDVFRIRPDSSRRLHAAATEALYQELDRQNTAADMSALHAAVQKLLASERLARQALNGVYADGGFVESGGLYQARGLHLMESAIATFVKDRQSGPAQHDLLRQEPLVEQAISEFEQDEHPLDPGQKAAIRLALESRITVITGGAGVGKTTLLKALYRCISHTQGRPIQMALAGRAAKRMSETTGQPARTIAGFLKNFTAADLAEYTHVVIDEASMLDVLAAYKIIRRLPANVNLILVGDAAQLPPIGPGLMFHLLVDMEAVPLARLTKIHRQAGTSGIPGVAQCIREGVWPDLTPYEGTGNGVSFIPADADTMAETVLGLYEELGGVDEDVRVLCATKANRPWGTGGVNSLLHDVSSEGLPEIAAAGGCPVSVGEPVIYTVNDWDRGILNGSLGRVLSLVEEDVAASDSEDMSPACTATFDGKEITLTIGDMALTDLAYAITVHKAQGSAFRRVIVPVWRSKLLDRTLLYTAITRAVDQVVLVGDEDAARRATEAPPFVLERVVGLRHMLTPAAQPA